jgi:threonine/homoserine/homoserine lactone efflux protein
VTVASAVGSFALVAGLLTIVPGLDTALVLRTTVARGQVQGFLAALGIGTGSLIWGVAAAVGVSALLTASTLAYAGLRIVGAGYMIWLGARMILSGAFRPASRAESGPAEESGETEEAGPIAGASAAPDTASSPTPSASGCRSWSQGLLTNLLNPKIGAFYLSMLPQFIPPHTSALAMGVLLALVHDLEGMTWFALIILGTHGIRDWLRRRSVQRTVDGLTGAVLVGFGLRLGTSARL